MSPCVHLGTDKIHIATANLIHEQCVIHVVYLSPEYHLHILVPEIPRLESHSFSLLWILLSEDSILKCKWTGDSIIRINTQKGWVACYVYLPLQQSLGYWQTLTKLEAYTQAFMSLLVEHLLCAVHSANDIIPGIGRCTVWWERHMCTHSTQLSEGWTWGQDFIAEGCNCDFGLGLEGERSLPAGGAEPRQFVFSELFLIPNRMSGHLHQKVIGSWGERSLWVLQEVPRARPLQSLEYPPGFFRLTALRQFKEKGEESLRKTQPTESFCFGKAVLLGQHQCIVWSPSGRN